MQLGNATCGVKFDLVPGDIVLLVFCEKSIGLFLKSGSVSDTKVQQNFDLSNAFAIPVFFPGLSGQPGTGDITVYNNGSGNIVLGDSASAEKLLNSTFKTMIFDNHIHTGGTIEGSTGIPTAIPDLTGLSMTNKVRAQ